MTREDLDSSGKNNCNVLRANWNLGNLIKTLVTQRNTLSFEAELKSKSSKSSEAFGFNLATHVGDELSLVESRRKRLRESFLIPSEPAWLNQVSKNKILCLEDSYSNPSQNADASFSFVKNRVCVINTADCLPILLSDAQGNFVAAIHAGWQGLELNIIADTISLIQKKAKKNKIELQEMHAYIAPAISQSRYQVGEDFREKFLAQDKSYDDAFIKEESSDTYLADLKAIAKKQLSRQGVSYISDSGVCTYQDNNFYSHRRATHLGLEKEGRFSSMIWKVS